MTTDLHPWRREFPNFPADVIPRLGQGWEDQSWDQDACPKFVHDAAELNLWVDYPDPDMRESPIGKLYTLNRIDPDGNSGDTLFETDDWAAMAARITQEVETAMRDPFRAVAVELRKLRDRVASFHGCTITGGQYFGPFVADQTDEIAKIDAITERVTTLRRDLVQACADAAAGETQEGVALKRERWDPESSYGKGRRDAAQDVLDALGETVDLNPSASRA